MKTDWTVSFNAIMKISVSGMLFVHRECILQTRHCFCSFSSSVVHVPGVNDIQSSSSTGQNLTQISRQLNQGQVAWTGNRPPFPGQVLSKSVLSSWSLKICNLCAFYKRISKTPFITWLNSLCRYHLWLERNQFPQFCSLAGCNNWRQLPYA